MKLILFFNGWGMDDVAVKELQIPQDFEIKILNYPYDTAEIDFYLYEERYIVGWSFGVYYASKFMRYNPEIDFKRRIAINGVPETIGNYGIPERIFDATLQNLSEDSLKEFYFNMGTTEIESKKDFEEIRAELQYFKDNYEKEENRYDIAIIGENDIIIPALRQKKYYKKNLVRIEMLEAPHYPFKVLKSWTEILNF